MATITIKVTTAGRGQIPHDIREKLNIREGDTLIVEIKDILKSNEPEDQDKKMEVPA
jgi:AbrB family looped-hinge helix DNA binding protein